MATAIPVINTIDIETVVSTEAPVQASFWQRAKARALDIAKRIASPIAAAGRTTAKAVKTAAVTTAKAVKRTALKVGAAIKRTAKAVVSKVRGSKTVSTTATKLSFGQRAKARAKRLAERMAARQRAIRASFASPTSVVGKVRTWIRDAWRRVLRPFLKLRVIAFTVVIGAVALVVAPLFTLAFAFCVGAMLWSLSHVVERLEASTSRAARMTLKVIEAIAQGLKVLAYITAAALTVFVAMGSVAFALAEVLELVLRYFDVMDAVGLSTLFYFLLSGNWVVFCLLGTLHVTSYSRAAARKRAVDQQTVKVEHGNRRTTSVAQDSYLPTTLEKLPSRAGLAVDEIALVEKGDFEAAAQLIASRATGSMGHTVAEARTWVSRVGKEENISPRRVKLPKCSACGIDDGGARFGLRNHKGLCSGCFDKLDNEDALNAAKDGRLTKTDVATARKHGVKVPKQVNDAVNNRPVNQRVSIPSEEFEKLSARVNSQDDHSKIHWAETARWYDRDSKPHGREWLGFVDGSTVAMVEYHHEKNNRGFEAWLLGATRDADRKVGMFHGLVGAQDAIGDALTNQQLVVGGMLDALAEEAPVPTPVVEKTDALVFHEANEFASPEEHIAHVRKTQGDTAAGALEEQYLREMIAKESTS